MFEAFEKGVRKIRGVGKVTASRIKVAANVRTYSEFAEEETMRDLRSKPMYRRQELEYGRRMKQHAERMEEPEWEENYYKERKEGI